MEYFFTHWRCFIMKIANHDDGMHSLCEMWDSCEEEKLQSQNSLRRWSLSVCQVENTIFWQLNRFVWLWFIFFAYSAREPTENWEKMHLISSFSFPYFKQWERVRLLLFRLLCTFFHIFLLSPLLLPLPTSFVSYRLENFIYIFIHSFVCSLACLHSQLIFFYYEIHTVSSTLSYFSV